MAHINHSAMLSADPFDVWHLLRQFGAISTWHPEVRLCAIAGGEDTGNGGLVRTLYLVSGEVFHERLVAIDNDQMTMTYGLTGPNMSVEKFTASLSVSRSGSAASSLVEWSAQVEASDEGLEARYESLVGEFVLNAMDGLAKHLGVGVLLDVEM